jgi:hypothetical protein
MTKSPGDVKTGGAAGAPEKHCHSARLAVAVAGLFGALSGIACKQNIGDRCLQGSDCSSGYCSEQMGTMMISAQGGVCSGPPIISSYDASTGADLLNEAGIDVVEGASNDDLSRDESSADLETDFATDARGSGTDVPADGDGPGDQ